jgi:ribosomal protein L28
LVNGQPKRIRVCTSCIKSGKITKHSATPRAAAPAAS